MSRFISPLDLDLVSGAHAAGHSWLTVRQVERWRQAGVIPRRPSKGLGRGLGTAVEEPPWSLSQLLAACQLRERGYQRLDDIVLLLWYDSWVVPFEEVKRQAIEVFEGFSLRIKKRLKEVSNSESPEFDVAQEEAQRELKRLTRERWKFARELAMGSAETGESYANPKDAVTGAQTQLNQLLIGDQDVPLDAQLLSRYLRFDAFDQLEGRESDYSAQEVIPEVAANLSLDIIVAAIQECPDAKLQFIREYLPWWRDRIVWARSCGHPKTEAWAKQADTLWDPRDPEFALKHLRIAIGIYATFIDDEPERVEIE